MKKTVIYEFPDDFKFPKKWNAYACADCPFLGFADDSEFCLITADDDVGPTTVDKETKRLVYLEHPDCPFYGGADTVNYGDYPYRPD